MMMIMIMIQFIRDRIVGRSFVFIEPSQSIRSRDVVSMNQRVGEPKSEPEPKPKNQAHN